VDSRQGSTPIRRRFRSRGGVYNGQWRRSPEFGRTGRGDAPPGADWCRLGPEHPHMRCRLIDSLRLYETTR